MNNYGLAKQGDTNLVVDHHSACMTLRVPLSALPFTFTTRSLALFVGSSGSFWRVATEVCIRVRCLILQRYVGRVTSFFLIILGYPIYRVLDRGDVNSDLNFAIGRIRTGMRFDHMGDIKCLSFAMTDSDYFMISGVQNHYSAVVAHRLGPRLDVNKKQSE